MSSLTQRAILLGLLALSLVGCARTPHTALATSSQSARVATSPLAFDPIEMSAEQNTLGSQTPTTAPTKVSAEQAIAVVSRSWRSSESSPTFITAREVFYSGYGTKNTIVWLVAAAPVLAHRHGLRPGTVRARGVYAVDASTGKVLNTGFTSLLAGP